MQAGSVIPFPGAPAPGPNADDARAAELAARALAPASRRAYASDLRAWRAWLADTRRPADADALAAFVGSSRMPSTAARRCAAVARAHPEIDPARARAVARGLRRDAPAPRRAKPLRARALMDLLDGLGNLTDDVRDRSLMLIGWIGGLRRAEIARLAWTDVQWESDGLLLRLLGQKGAPAVDHEHAICRMRRPEYCPVKSLEIWRDTLRAAGRYWDQAPVWQLSESAINRMVQRRAKEAIFENDGYSAHSLRAGMLTEAAHKGVPTYRLRDHSRHRRTDSLDLYVRGADRLRNHPAARLLD